MKDRFRFRAFYNNPYEEDDCDNKKMFYDAENTYDFLNGVPASSFGDIIDSDFWTVEQCTGLKDKNGKLIYEGDLIKSPSNSHVLEVFRYIDGTYMTREYRKNGYNELSVYQFIAGEYGIEVVGNIHQNPELLKDEEDDQINKTSMQIRNT